MFPETPAYVGWGHTICRSSVKSVKWRVQKIMGNIRCGGIFRKTLTTCPPPHQEETHEHQHLVLHSTIINKSGQDSEDCNWWTIQFCDVLLALADKNSIVYSTLMNNISKYFCNTEWIWKCFLLCCELMADFLIIVKVTFPLFLFMNALLFRPTLPWTETLFVRIGKEKSYESFFPPIKPPILLTSTLAWI